MKIFFKIFFLFLPALVWGQQDTLSLKQSASAEFETVSFYDNGNLKYLKTRDNENTGLIETYYWYENGNLKRHSRDQNNYHSLTEYYDNGRMKFDSIYSGAIPTYYRQFYDNGQLKKEYKGLWEHKYPLRVEINEYDRDGTYIRYKIIDTLGVVSIDEKYPFQRFKGIQSYCSFYTNGKLFRHGYYKIAGSDTVKMGVWIAYYLNGSMKTVGLYTDNIPWGLHMQFDSTGNLLNKAYYEKGMEVKNFETKCVKQDSIYGGGYTYNGYREGLVSNDSKNKRKEFSYYYKSLLICGVYAYSDFFSQKDNESWRIKLPYAEYLSIDKNYPIVVESGRKMRENNMFFRDGNGDDACCGNTIVKSFEKKKYSMEGNIVMDEKLIEGVYDIFKGDFHTVNSDTTFYYDPNGKIYYMQIYGSHGQLIKQMVKEDNKPDWKLKEKINPYYAKLYIKIQDRWVEIKDNYTNLPGERKIVTDSGVVLSQGYYKDTRVGRWIDNYKETGKPHIIKYYYDEDRGYTKPRSRYKEYHSNGKLYKKGKYNSDEKETGLWKEYTEDGKLDARGRFWNGNVYGFAFERCKNKKGIKRIVLVFYWKGYDIIYFGKCHNFWRGPTPTY